MKELLKKAKGFFASRGFSSGSVTAMVIAVVVAFNAVIYALTAAFGLYIYSPEDIDCTISGNTDRLYSEAIALEKEVTVTFLFTEDELLKHSSGKYVLATAKEFAERYDFIKLKYVNLLTRVDENGDRVDLTKYKESGAVLRQTSVIFECDGNFRVVTDAYSSLGFADFFVLDDSGEAHAYIGEELMASMISWVLERNHDKKVYFTTNHSETADASFSKLLSCAGYTVDFINLMTTDVPEDAEFLVISDPQFDLSKGAAGSGIDADAERLTDYLDRGGKLIVALDPYGKKMPVLESILSKYGIEIAGAEVSDGRYVREIVKDLVDSVSTDGLSFVATHASEGVAGDIAAVVEEFSSGRVLLSQCGRLKLNSAKGAVPILLSSDRSVSYLEGNVADREGSYVVSAYSEKANEDGSTASVFVVPGIYLTATNALIAEGFSNKDFIYSLLEECFGALCAPYGTTVVDFDAGGLESFTMGMARAFTIILMIVPSAVAVLGTATIIRRRNR